MTDAVQIILLTAILYYLYRGKTVKPFKVPAVHKDRKLIIDTCALIDGRIIDLSRCGFVPDELIIPQFILAELQMLADGHDAHKRERGRYGLDAVKQLQDSNYCTVTIDRSQFNEIREIDDKLVALAKKLTAQLYTTDYNLNKVAEIEGVRVLNVNELAQNVRPIALPGEKKTLKILQQGSNRDQGVGYLEDGTMVVVDGASKMVGKTVELEISRMHQTVAGKMLFGQILNSSPQRVAAPLSKDQKLRQRLSPRTKP